MIRELLLEVDKVAAQALKAGAQPIAAGTDIAYEAGRRIGYSQGVAATRQQLIEFYSRDTDKDRDL